MRSKLLNFFFNTTLYKTVCVCAFILVPSVFFCFFPQIISAVLLLWGAAILLHDLFKERSFAKSAGSIFLLLFVVGYVFTLLFYAKNDMISTLNLFCWTIIEFFLLFAIDRHEKKDITSLLKELHKINFPITIVMLVAGVLSLICFFAKIAVVMPDPEGLNTYWAMGIVNGRNSGIFNNPIPCASAMFIGCIAAMWNFFYATDQRRRKIYYILVYIIGFLCIQTTLTRTYVYGIYLFTAVAVFAGCIQFWNKSPKKAKRFFTSLGAMILSTVLVVTVGQISKKGMVRVLEKQEVHKILINVDQLNGDDKDKDLKEIEEEINKNLALDAEVTLSRDEIQRLPSFFYPRNEIWKVALQVIPHSPLFGFSTGNFASSSLEYGHTEYFENNWKSGIPTYHNGYVDIAVASGLVGLILMIFFLGFQIIRTLRVLFGHKLPNHSFCYGIMIAFLAVHVFFISLFFGTITFCNLGVCLYFWIILGYTSKINGIVLNKNQDLSVCGVLESIKKICGKNA